MSEVFKADQERSGRQVAIKVLSREFSDYLASRQLSPELSRRLQLMPRTGRELVCREFSRNQSLVKEFLAEQEDLSKMAHPSIVAWSIDHGTTRDLRLFFAAELAEGDSLRRVIREGMFTVAQRVQIVLDLAETLAKTHTLDIIHGHLNPDNVLVKEDGERLQVKLLDFGMAGLLEESPVQVDCPPPGAMDECYERSLVGDFLRDANLDRPGAPVLPPAYVYLAPEQNAHFWGGRRVDHRIDIYSLGVLFYELLTGVRPSHGESRAPSERNREVPPRFDRIVREMLRDDPLGRYQSMEEVACDLRESGLTSTAGAREPRPRQVGVDPIWAETPVVPVGPIEGPSWTECITLAYVLRPGLRAEVMVDLGRLLASWKSARGEIVRISGLQELLRGELPPHMPHGADIFRWERRPLRWLSATSTGRM